MDCTCGEGCTCNKSTDVVCDPCADFKRTMVAKRAKRYAIVVAQAPVRVDLAGGWSDTPPICYENPLGGSVLNVGVQVDGRKPVVCCCRITSARPEQSRNNGEEKTLPPHFIFRSLRVKNRDHESSKVFLEGPTDLGRTLADFASARKPASGDPHALLKACCIALGLVPDLSSTSNDAFANTSTTSVSNHLQALFGPDIGALELACVSDVPAGSGMGGSSVLAATVVAALLRLLARAGVTKTTKVKMAHKGLRDDDEEPSSSLVVYYTCLVEQILTTGGGWQDQCGALPGGFKLCQSSGSLPLSISAEVVDPSPDQRRAFLHEFHRRTFLVYTGVTRLARDTLISALRSFAYQPLEHLKQEESSEDHERWGTIRRLQQGAKTAARELQSNDSALTARARVDLLAERLNEYWTLKKEMARGSEPPHIAALLSYLRPYCSALSLCGAGAGGFAVVVLKADIASTHKEGGFNYLEELMKAYDPEMTVHSMTVDQDGLRTRVLEGCSSASSDILANSLR